MKTTTKLLKFLLLPALLFAAVHIASADTTYWQVDIGDWFELSNWGIQSPLLEGEMAAIDNGGTSVISSGNQSVKIYLVLGNNSDTSGNLIVNGNSLLNTSTLWVGNSGTGTMILNGSARVSSSAEAAIGYASVGAATLNDDAYWETNYTFSIGTFGMGTLILTGNSHMNSKFNAYLNRWGSGSNAGGSVFMSDSSIWSVVGSLIIGESSNIELTNNANLSIGCDYMQADSSTLGLDLSATTHVTLNGSATLGGTLDLLALSDVTTSDMFTLILLTDAGEVFSGEFAHVKVDGVEQMLTANEMGIYDFTYTKAGLDWQCTLNYNGGNGNDLTLTVVAPVPEPATWAMLAGGLGVLALLRRRRGGLA